MLIGEFLDWADGASAGERADAAGALAKAYLYADLDPVDTGDASRGLTLLLDDPSPLVRRALAEAFATAIDAPHHILATLAGDRSDIAAIVLERSPILGDAELIDAVAIGDDVSQCAVARRPMISAALAGAIAEVGCIDAALTLSRNAGADLTDFTIGRLLDRFGSDGALREVVLARHDLSPEMRHAAVVATANALGNFAVDCRWMAPDRAERVVAEARDRATITIASIGATDAIEYARFVAYLRSAGHLTPALVLRALLSGKLAMIEAILSELSGKSASRVSGLLRNPHGLGFTALYKSSGLPIEILPAFRVSLGLAITNDQTGTTDSDNHLDQRLVETVIAACAAEKSEDVVRLEALLRRFEAEAVRDGARATRNRQSGAESAMPSRARSSNAPRIQAAA